MLKHTPLALFGLLILCAFIGMIASCVPGVKYNHAAMEWQSRALDFEEIQKTTMTHAELIIEDNIQLRKENQKLRDLNSILSRHIATLLKAQAQR